MCVFTHSYNDDSDDDDDDSDDDDETTKKKKKSETAQKKQTKEVFSGVRYLKSGVKVYHVPRLTIRHTNCCYPTIFGTARVFRIACIRENVDVVHAHQGGTLSHECMLHAKTLGIPCCVFTDHSLFGMNDDVASIHSNKVLQMTLGEADKAVCVTNAAKENTCLRGGMNVVLASRRNKKRKERENGYDDDDDDDDDDDEVYELRGFDPRKIEVIPNAVDGEAFYPPSRAMEKKGNVNEGRFSNSSGRNSSGRSSRSSTSSSSKTNNEKEVTIVVCSRLTYRKGIHLLAKLIPLTLKENKNVRFIIAGSGPMEPHLREVCEKTHKKECKGKIEFLGDSKHEDVPNILRRGDIFLNCSLTEAFCTAIVEAASCGLLVVATAVGGVPEVLPGVTRVTPPSPPRTKRKSGETGRRKLMEKPKEITSSFLAPPTVSDLFVQLQKAIALVANGEVGDREREAIGDQILQKYSWSAVAKTTEKLYLNVLLEKENAKKNTNTKTWKKDGSKKRKMSSSRDVAKTDDDFASRLIQKYTSQGVVFGPLLCCVAAVAKLYVKVLEFVDPEEIIREKADLTTDAIDGGDDDCVGRFLAEKRERARFE